VEPEVLGQYQPSLALQLQQQTALVKLLVVMFILQGVAAVEQ
jgi:hypothetical protein